MDLLLPVFQLLYFVAHFLVSVCQAVYDTLLDIYNTTCNIYLWLTHSHTKDVAGGVGGVSKLPVHPVLVLLPGQYSSQQLPQLAQLLVTLVKAGVKHLSAYDAAGKLRDQQTCLKELIEAALPEIEVRLVTPAQQQSDQQQYVKTDSTSPDNKSATAEDVVRQRHMHSNAVPPDSSDREELVEKLSTDKLHQIAQQQQGSARHSSNIVLLNVVSFESGNSNLMSCVRHMARASHVEAVTVQQLHVHLTALNSDHQLYLNSKDLTRCPHVIDAACSSAALSNGGESSPNSADAALQQTINSKKDACQVVSNGAVLDSCERISEGEVASNCINNQCMTVAHVLPDPDLVVVVGEYLSSNGFPAWFLRLAEFVHAPNLKRLDSNALTRILERNAKIEQRYGR